MFDITGATLDGKYRLVRLIGRGGMGAVHEAEHLGTGRTVAVKTILPALLRDSAAVERFRREARAAGRLRHPNIVDVTDYGVAACDGSDVAYLAMEYLEGMTLQALIRAQGSLQLELVVAIIEQIALALDAAHAAGVVHRDLKPENVWLVPNPAGGYSVRVLDFGIAKLRDAPSSDGTPIETLPDSSIGTDTPTIEMRSSPTPMPASGGTTEPLTLAGTTLGTPAYMSPEQCRGTAVDARSDIYSLGIIAYEALSGRRPFVADRLRDLIEAHMEKPPEPLDAIAPVSRRVAAVVARALAKSPDDRYQSATAMAGSLYAAAEGASVILRRAASLYIDRFPSFFRVSLSASVPGLMLMLVLALLAVVAPHRAAAPLVILGATIAWTPITLMTNASFAVVIDELRRRPLREITAADVGRELRLRLGLDANASWPRMFGALVRFYVGAELKSRAGAGDIAFLIAFLESLPKEKVPDRCALLARTAKRSYDWIRASIIASVVVPLVIEGSIAFAMAVLFKAERPEDVAVLLAIPLVPLNAMFLNPIFSSALALLYFRARQANGEDVALTSVVSGRL